MMNNPKDRGPKRERRWQTSQERARVAAELIEEAESLTQTGAIATPLDLERDQQPPPIRVAQIATPGPTAKLDQDETPSRPEDVPLPPPQPPARPARGRGGGGRLAICPSAPHRDGQLVEPATLLGCDGVPATIARLVSLHTSATDRGGRAML